MIRSDYIGSVKVAVNARMLLPQLEGVGQYTYHLLHEMSNLHPEVEWHVIQDRSCHYDLLDQDNVHRHILHPQARHPLLWYYWFEYGIPRLLKRIGADVFFSPDGYGSTRVPTKQVITIHDLAYLHNDFGIPRSHRAYLSRYMESWLQKSDQVISVSNFTKNDLLHHFPIEAHKISAIPNGITDQFVPISAEEKQRMRDRLTGGRPYFLYVGALHPRKNIKRLIEAFEDFTSKNTLKQHCLLLMGRMAWSTSEIQQKLEHSIYKKDIIHLPHVDDVAPIIGAADLMCYVSLFEGFGLPVLEAMKCGVPVLTSRGSSMSEITGDAAILVDPKSIPDISQGFNHLINNNPNERIKKGLEKAAKYNWNKTAKATFKVLQFAATSHP